MLSIQTEDNLSDILSTRVDTTIIIKIKMPILQYTKNIQSYIKVIYNIFQK